MAVGLDGLASGLSTTELIASLMALEAVPQTLLKNKATVASTSVTALQALNTQIAALATLAKETGKATSLDAYSVTSSSTKVTATAGTGAAGGTIDIVVDALAQAQTGVTAPMTAWSSPPVVTIVGSDGTETTITANSSSLDDIVKAVNASAAGVTVTKVASGTNADGDPQFRLQFSGKETGASGAFEVFQGTAADGVDVFAQTGSAVTRQAQDASVKLFAGTAAEQVITSKSNTFTDLLPGVSITVAGVSTDPVSITVARDSAKASTTASTLISTLNSALAYISTRTVAVSSTDADGNAIVSGGVFTGDSTTRELTAKLLSAASAPIDGHSPSEYGISITKSGTMEFDADKFAAAFAKDPAAVQKAISEIGTRIGAAATNASDKTTGTITTKITGTQSTVTSLNAQVEKWDDRLATRKTNLERMYTAFEVRMSNMNAQMTWLTSQVDALQAAAKANN